MTLVTLQRDLYHVLAVCRIRGSDEPECELFDLLYNEEGNDTDVPRMTFWLEEVARSGPPAIGLKSKHLGDGIFEFKAGDLRVLYFYDEGQLVICTNHFVKKTRCTPPKELKKAKKAMKQYFQERNQNSISIVSKAAYEQRRCR